MQTSVAAAACIVGSDSTNQSGSSRLWETAWRALEPLPLLMPLCSILASLGALQVLVMPPATLTALMLAPTLFMHVVGPIIDVLLGEHPPRMQTAAEVLAVAAAGHMWANYGTVALSKIVLLTLCLGNCGAVGVSGAHELVHCRHGWVQSLAVLRLAWVQFTCFPRLHHHHHKHVGTHKDTITARLNESVYHFIVRDYIATHAVPWRMECEAAEKAGRSVWSVCNKMLQALALQAATLVMSWYLGGWAGLCVHLAAAGLSLTLIMASDYLLHYGVIREEQASGGYEPLTQYDAFNSAYIIENSITFRVLLHSDHHAVYKPPGQLSFKPGSPTLSPMLFLGLFAFIPPVWFKIANPRSLAAMEAKRQMKMKQA